VSPSEFPQVAVRRIFDVVNGATPDSQNPAYWDGPIPWVTPEDLSNRQSAEIVDSKRTLTSEGYAACGTSLVPTGAIVLSTRAPIGSLGIAATQLCTNQGCKSLVPLGKLSPRYFFYQLSVASAQLNRLGKGTTFLELSSTELAGFKVSAPALPVQERIANFLDDKTARIDALIAEKEKLIETLIFRRESELCRHLVPNLFEDSTRARSMDGWRGGIRSGWTTKHLRRLLLGGLSNGVFKKRDEFGAGTLLINVSDLYREDFQVDPANLERVTVSSEEYQRFAVSPGDMFFVRSSLKEEGVAVSALANKVPEPMVFECHVVRARPDTSQVVPRFLNIWLNSTICRQSLRCNANTTTMTTIDQEGLLSVGVPLPPLDEQGAIVSKVERLFDATAGLTAVARAMQERLREYRSSLISAAVTGQLDISTFKLSTPSNEPEPELAA
jgi:type I restriction enzyme, S subunit